MTTSEHPARALRRARLVSVVVALALGAVGAWAFWDLPVHHDVTQFVPSTGASELAPIARDVLGSELTRTIIIAVHADDEPLGIAAARDLAERLRAVEGVAWVSTGPSPEVERAFYELYYPRRYAFFAEDAEGARARLTDEALRESARRLRQELTGPMAMMVRRAAQDDPLLAFMDRARQIPGTAEGGPHVVDGQLVSEDGWALVLLASEAAAFDTVESGPLLASIDRAIADVSAAHEAPLRFQQSSIHRFAHRAETEIRGDVQRISTLSTLGIMALLLALYRSPRYLILGGLPLLAGTIAATAACRLVFGSVHGITFAFGSSLLGVGIDYVAHYVNHEVLEPHPDGPMASMRTIWMGLALGAATTIAGLAGLGYTAFPGMREMALFAAVGVTASLLATRWLLPPWMPPRREAPRITRALARGATAVWARLQRRRAPFLLLPAAAIAVIALGVPRLEWIDDIRALNNADPALVAEDTAVRARVARGASQRLVIAVGRHDEEALARADAAHRVLDAAREEGVVTGFRSVHPFLRSAATQRAVQRAVVESPGLAERIVAALDAEGFVASMFEPLGASLAATQAAPVRWEELAASPLADLVRPFRVELDGGRVAYVAFVDDATDPAALSERLGAIDGVSYFDQGEYMAAAYGEFRSRTTELLAIGLIVVFGMCVARYRSLRLGLASIAPAVLAAATALGFLGLVGESANLMHLVGALLVLSMGEDYAVFLLEARDDAKGVATAMVGIGVACLTTVLAFGLLAMSSHPALRALGLMAAIGVSVAFVLAPFALLLAPSRVDPRTDRRESPT